MVWGDGSEEKDLLYVKDLTKLIQTVIEQQDSNFELINVGSGRVFTIKTIVENMIKIFKKDLNIKYDLTKPSRKKGLKLNIDKVNELFGWKPITSIEEGIDETFNWYRTKEVL